MPRAGIKCLVVCLLSEDQKNAASSVYTEMSQFDPIRTQVEFCARLSES